MPLHRIERITNDKAWALWKTEESLEQLMDLFKPDSQDSERLAAIHHPQKRREWLASRLALKHLLYEMGENYVGTYDDEYGKPHPKNCPFHISISHTKGYAAAIVCKNAPVGIDVEPLNEKLHLIAERVLNPSELTISLKQTSVLCVYWCVKEVIYKLYGKRKISLRDDIYVLPFEMAGDEGKCKAELKLEGLKTVYDVRYLKVDNHFVAFSL